jgi:hypothetical protein
LKNPIVIDIPTALLMVCGEHPKGCWAGEKTTTYGGGFFVDKPQFIYGIILVLYYKNYAIEIYGFK